MLVLEESVNFDEDGNGEGVRPSECHMTCIGEPDIVLPAASLTDVQDRDRFPQDIATEVTAGWMYLNLNGLAGLSTARSTQGWVVVSMRAEGRYSVDFDATALGNGCSPAAPITEFTNWRAGAVGALPGPALDVIP